MASTPPQPHPTSHPCTTGLEHKGPAQSPPSSALHPPPPGAYPQGRVLLGLLEQVWGTVTSTVTRRWHVSPAAADLTEPVPALWEGTPGSVLRMRK